PWPGYSFASSDAWSASAGASSVFFVVVRRVVHFFGVSVAADGSALAAAPSLAVASAALAVVSALADASSFGLAVRLRLARGFGAAGSSVAGASAATVA